MNCKRIRRYIIELLDGDLAQKEKTKLLSHLETCRECRDRWGYQISLSEKLNSSMDTFSEGLEVPRGLFYDIMREIRKIPQPKLFWEEVFGAVLRIPKVAYASLIMILGVFITLGIISITNIAQAHPLRFLAKQRMIIAHSYFSEEGLPKRFAYSQVRDIYRFRIGSKSYIRKER